ncbi:cytochrome P450 [Favolaschia claudopus]|uniref:Cytochrome P450 n=1 Tax=Favolaschia claudopus TaxID=2862362 RepID=A0AAW0DUJ9_9AGAR
MIATFLALVFVGCIARLLITGRRERTLPPGPPTIPILGNLHILPQVDQSHLKFTEWARRYGDIFSIKIASNTMVVLSSATAIKEIVDKSSWIASSRPPKYISILSAGGYHVLFACDTPLLRKIRKAIARFLSPAHAMRHSPIRSAESTQLLYELMTHPEDFSKSIGRYMHSIAMLTTYGQRVPSAASPNAQYFMELLHQSMRIHVHGNFPPIDLIPVLKYLPERWAPWLAISRRSRAQTAALHSEFTEVAISHVSSAKPEDDTARQGECFISYISKMRLSPEEFDTFSYSAFTLTEAGTDTTATYLRSLVLILAVYPEYQERARQEIDDVVGLARLPELADFSQMPFINALIKEVTRIQPIFPTGIPHYTTEDIRYKDYIIPKNTTVIMNIYSIFRNPDIFDEPEVFNPERYIQSEHGTRDGMDTDFRDNLIFGAGRRICAGESMARNTIQLTAMRLIWAFSFSSAVDPQTSRPVPRDLDFYEPGFMTTPHPFRCTIQVRSGDRREVILRAFDDAKEVLQRYER